MPKNAAAFAKAQSSAINKVPSMGSEAAKGGSTMQAFLLKRGQTKLN